MPAVTTMKRDSSMSIAESLLDWWNCCSDTAGCNKLK